jgi:phage virion morphogenesis protein
MIELRLTSDVDRLLVTLQAGEHLTADMSPVMRQAAGILAGATEDAFADEKAPSDGKKWVPLALSTQGKVIRGKIRGAHPILQVSGQLAASVSTSYDKQSATISTNKVQAALMQLGGIAGRAEASRNVKAGMRARSAAGRSSSRDYKPFQRPRIPAREYIGVGASHMTRIEQAALAYMVAKLGGGSVTA